MKAKAKVVKQEEKGARILYKNISSDQVVILGFEGILTGKEIKGKYGELVLNAYFTSFDVDNSMALHYQGNGEQCLHIKDRYVYEGAIIENEKFSDLISKVKKCGKRLAEIIKANRENPVKEVRI